MNLRLSHLIIALPLSFLLSSCGLLNVSTQKTLYLDHYLHECVFSDFDLCNREREHESDPWTLRYFGIEGFTYEWGFTYELRVRETRIANPPADGPSVRTELIELVSKEKVLPATRFRIALTTYGGGAFNIDKVGDGFAFYGTGFVCAADALCAEIGTLIGQKGTLTLEFTHPETPGDPLVAQRVVSFQAALDR